MQFSKDVGVVNHLVRKAIVVCAILVVFGLLAGAVSASEPEIYGAMGIPAVAGPDAVPNPPYVQIQLAGSAIDLVWEHPDSEVTRYQAWRSEDPYFEPKLGEGTQLGSYTFSLGIYGVGAAFSYVDDGVCGYFIAAGAQLACTPQNPTVTVTGDVGHNYFWVVRGGNSAGEFADSNRVGEFDFALVRGA